MGKGGGEEREETARGLEGEGGLSGGRGDLWMTREVQGNDTQRWFAFSLRFVHGSGYSRRVPPAVDLQLPRRDPKCSRDVLPLFTVPWPISVMRGHYRERSR